LLVAAVVAVATLPLWGGALGAWAVTRVLSAKLGLPVQVHRGLAGPGTLYLYGLVVGGTGGQAPLASIDRLALPLAALWGAGTVEIDSARFEVHRGGPHDNVSALLARLERGPGAGRAAGGRGGRALPRVVVRGAAALLDDAKAGRQMKVGRIDADLTAGGKMTVHARQIDGQMRLRGTDSDPTFGAAAIDVEGALVGGRPVLYPEVRITDGFVRPLPTLPLTGITGTLRPAAPASAGAAPAVVIELAGSYGGARRSLWTARGTLVDLPGGLEGTLSLRAERFSLDRIADILPASVLRPADTRIDAAMDFGFSAVRVAFTGNLEVTGLSVQHEKLAADPILGLGFAIAVRGAVEPGRRRLEIARLEGRLGALVGTISGSIELAPGTFRYADGSELAALPKIELSVKVPRISCAKLLTSIPAPAIPRLQGFVLHGTFEADLHTRIDYANLDALELGGKVGIDGCRVMAAPDEVVKLAGPDSIIQMVDVPPRPGAPGTVETYIFPIGPDNPDFVPFDRISPYLINSIMTTEDNGFFKHRGWVTPEFKTALRRNLQRGAFRYGASSITMQMVKNVLLAHEKTLSRKLQELFLTWYVEQQLPKQRILELYFNAIEFGPRLYGIGSAARHYFGKAAADLTPLEAAFFSSILPSPKRRYIQYCAGVPNARWDKYVRRILAKIHERGRITDEEYLTASAGSLTFDVSARGMSEKQCMDWVKRMTQRPEPEPEPDAE
jgi:Transglycosylase